MEKLALTGLTHAGSFELEPGFNTLGRNPTNDFRVHDATVSSFHCEIVLSDDSVVVRDLGSTNGTYIDGLRIQENVLKPGQILKVGSAELRLDFRSDTETALVSIPKVGAGQAAPVQTMLPGDHPACLNHSDSYAAYRCARCEKTFCVECVHVLRLAGGTTRVFCPSCSGHCESLPLPPGVATVPSKKKESLFGRLTQTIRIRFK